MAELTPMMKQYFEIKEKCRDYILFYRLGDFYEMFFDDAILVSRELELTLTGRDCGQEERAPMCGVPYHAHGRANPNDEAVLRDQGEVPRLYFVLSSGRLL